MGSRLRTWTGRAVAALVLATIGALTLATTAGAQAPRAESVDLTLLSSHDLAVAGLDGQVKPRGQNGDVAILGRTAFVGGGALFHGAQSTSGRICTDYGGVKVVDLTNPAQPNLLTTITIEDLEGVGAPWLAASPRRGKKYDNVSVSAGALDVLRHPVSGRDILAIATQRCEPSFFLGARIEFWDVTNRTNPVRVGTFNPATIVNPRCNPGPPVTCPPGVSPATGQWGIFEDVRMVVRGDRVYALATTPFSIGNAHDASPFGDFRLIDITDVSAPQQVGTFPPVSLGEGTVNGCRTFMAGRAVAPTPDGSRAVLSFYDGTPAFEPAGSRTAAVFELDLNNLPRHTSDTPFTLDPMPRYWGYPRDRNVEGNAADVETFTGALGRLFTIVSEDDVSPERTTVTVDAPASAAGSVHACQTPVSQRLYELPNQQLTGEIAYLGRGCPASPVAGTMNTAADEYLGDPSGKIALLETGGGPFDGCSTVERVNRAIAAGATAVLMNGGGEDLNFANNGPPGGKPSRPNMVIQGSGFRRMQLVPTHTVVSTGFPATWGRTSTTNVTLTTFPGRTDKGRFRSVANASDRAAGGFVTAANRFPVSAGESYRFGAFVEVSALTAGSFGFAIEWFDGAGTSLGESAYTFDAVTPRVRIEDTVVTPAGAARASLRFGWEGSEAEGTAFVDSFSLVPVGLRATLRDERGEWGAQRFLDFSQPAITEVGSYRSPRSMAWPPPNDGIYAPRLARTFGSDLAFTTWMSDGLRVLDVSDPSSPREIGAYVPPDTPDPAPAAGAGDGLMRGQVWPNRALVTGVDTIRTGPSSGIVVVSDINAGLYVLSFQARYGGRDCTIVGTEGDDDLVGTDGPDVICALGGNDRVRALAGNDVVYGGPGNDVLIGGLGDDTLHGGAGSDEIRGGIGDDVLRGHGGGDTLLGESGDDRLFGGPGGDRLFGGSGNDVIRGGDGGDRIEGHAGGDRLFGERGGDTIRGWAGNDHIVGGPGRDILRGDSGNDTFLARDGFRDRLDGGAGTDRARVDRIDVVRLVERRF